MTDTKEDQDFAKRIFPDTYADTFRKIYLGFTGKYLSLNHFYHNKFFMNDGDKRKLIDKEYMDKIQGRLSELLDMFADKNMEEYMKDPSLLKEVSDLKQKSSKEIKDYLFSLNEATDKQIREIILRFLAAKINESLILPNPPPAPMPK